MGIRSHVLNSTGAEKSFARISGVGASGRKPNEIYDKPMDAICQYAK